MAADYSLGYSFVLEAAMRRLERLIGAAFIAGVLIAAGAAAEEARHLAGQAPVSVADAKARCVPALVKPGETCTVGAFGPAGAVAGRDFLWAHYDFKAAPGDPLDSLPWTRIVIFERPSAGTLRPILISGDDPAFWYDEPGILRAGGRIVLHLPANESGTGNFNRELLYAWANDAWHDVDVTAWQDELAHRLPKGLVILKGVYPDYEKMAAETPVWRQQDGPTCAEGGRARIELQWRDDRIAVGSVRVGKAGECGEALPP
jgi:hypothetical protein